MRDTAATVGCVSEYLEVEGMEGKWRANWRRCVVISGAMAALLAGCHDDQLTSESTAPATDSKKSTLRILTLAREEERRSVDATVEFGEEIRRVAISRWEDGPVPGMVAEISTGEGEPLFRIEVAVDDATGHFWYRERTPSDQLAGSFRQTRDRVYEEYTVNGKTFTTDYPNIGPAGVQRVKAWYFQGALPSDATPAFREVTEKFAEFDEFYRSYRSGSLHDNREGEHLMAFLSDAEVATEVTGKPVNPIPIDGTDASLRVEGWDSRFCWASAFCMRFKCPTNPLCVPCTGATIACVFMEIACWIGDCDCCF
jgi:hypothetical protein